MNIKNNIEVFEKTGGSIIFTCPKCMTIDQINRLANMIGADRSYINMHANKVLVIEAKRDMK